MILKETKNPEDIKKVLCNPIVYDCISSDNCPTASEFEPPINSEYRYIAGFVKGEIIGVMVYHSYKDGEECHVQVLPEYRKEYAAKFGKQVLLFKSESTLYAEIPSLYQNVLEFAVLNNFKILEKEDKSYIKNGVNYPVFTLEYEG